MTKRKNERQRSVPSPALPARAIRPELTASEQWYLDSYLRLYRAMQQEKPPRVPSVLEFALYVGRSVTPAYRALTKAESVGRLARDARRSFVPTEKAS